MKRIITFLVIGLMLSCTMDEEMIQPSDQFDQINVLAEYSDCVVDVLNFPAGGSVSVTNDNDKIYLSVTANSDYELSKVNFQISEAISEFPVEINGNLIPQKLENSKTFDKGITSHTFSIERNSSLAVFITIHSTFKRKSGPTVSGWAGDLSGINNTWVYFDYAMCVEQSDPCAEFTAGADYIKVLTLTEAKAIPNKDKVTELFLSFLEPGVPLNGTFDPTIDAIITAFASEKLGGVLGDYTTIYTVSEGECSDSVELTLRIIPDPVSDPVCELDAGQDNMITLTLTQAKAIPNNEKVKQVYLSLLEPGVALDGTFDPTVEAIVKAFASEKLGGVLGDYTTTYTITEGDCSDSVELTIRVIAD